MTDLLGVIPAGITIDVALTFGGFFIGCVVALIYVHVMADRTPVRPVPPPIEVPREAVVNDTARANMAAQQLRDLAHNVASDVDAHNSLVEGISDQLGALSKDDAANGPIVMEAVAKILEANNKLQARLEDAEQKIQVQADEIRTQQSEARTDALTKLANRRAFDACLEENMARFQQGGWTFSMLIMDVDHFKKFNDEHGHQAGDEVLRCVGRTLGRTVKSGDLACRYGGEEFAVIMPNTNAADGKVAAERVRRAIEAMPVNFAGKSLRVAVSVGLAECLANEDAARFLRRADDAVYSSKKAGRNRSYWHNGVECLPIEGPVKPAVAAFQPKPIVLPRQKVDVSAASLPNRAAFTNELRRRVAECHRSGGALSVIHYRVKDYRHLEDTYGSAVGALLLDALAIFIRSTLRDMDLLGRLEDGEFIVMLPGTTTSAAKIVGQRVKSSISLCPIPLGEQHIRLELHMGVAGVLPDDDAPSTLASAREAMEVAAAIDVARAQVDAAAKAADEKLVSPELAPA